TNTKTVPTQGQDSTNTKTVPTQGQDSTNTKTVPTQGQDSTNTKTVPIQGQDKAKYMPAVLDDSINKPLVPPVKKPKANVEPKVDLSGPQETSNKNSSPEAMEKTGDKETSLKNEQKDIAEFEPGQAVSWETKTKGIQSGTIIKQDGKHWRVKKDDTGRQTLVKNPFAKISEVVDEFLPGQTDEVSPAQNVELEQPAQNVESEGHGIVGTLKKKLTDLEKLQGTMKAANKIAKSKNKTKDLKIKELVNIGLSEKSSKGILEPDYAGRIGFPSYALTNNNATIRRTRSRLIELESKAQEETTEINFDGEIISDNNAIEIEKAVDEKADANKETEYVEQKTENSHGTSDIGTTQESHPGPDTNRTPKPGSRLDSTSNLADRQQTPVDTTDVFIKPEEVVASSDVSDTKSRSLKGDQEKRGDTGPGSDRRDNLQSDSGPADHAGRGTDGRRDPGKDNDLERQPVSGSRRGRDLSDKNHRIDEKDILAPAGPESKIKANIKAIRLLKKLEKADRNPTPAEKKTLAQYVGWGAFSQKVFNNKYSQFHENKEGKRFPEHHLLGSAFDKYKLWLEKYGKKLHPGLNGLMTQEEWNSATGSTLNAHYTSKEVISQVWSLIERLGLKKGHVLEPSAGVGHFMGMVPQGIDASFHGVEMDSLTGRILKKLYPESHIQVSGFENARGLSNNSMDVVVSNFPFGDYQVFDKNYKEYSKWNIHNYFFGKSIDIVRPGGLVVGITSHHTLDAVSNGKIRKTMGEKADLIGAIRLPMSAFKKDAGTEVVTDIIVFRKKDGTEQIGERFRSAGDIKIGKETAHINEYFIENPDMILGENSMQGSMYGGNEYTVLPASGELSEQIAKVVEKFPENIIGEGRAETHQEEVYAKEDMKDGVLTIFNGKVRTVENGKLVEPTAKNTKGQIVKVLNTKSRIDRATAYIQLRDTTQALIKKMLLPGVSDQAIEKDLKGLDAQYDTFVKKHNFLNSTGNSFLQKIDNDFPIVDALENIDIEATSNGLQKKIFSKADLLKKRTIFPFTEPDSADNITDAIPISMIYKNKIDTAYISRLTGMNEDLARTEILEKQLAYVDPETGMLVTPDQYLSGNVKKKLQEAKKAAKKGNHFNQNVQALEDVQPEELDIEFISFKLGSTWIPAENIQDFVKHLVDLDVDVKQIRTQENSTWQFKLKKGEYLNTKATKIWGTTGADAIDLIKDALNLKRSKVYVPFYPPGGGKRTLVEDKEQSLVAQKKQEEIQKEFKTWVRSSDKWAGPMTEAYNTEYNGFVPRSFKVPEIDSFPGANPVITLRDLQKKAVGRCLQESTLLSYGVGTGKTFTFVTLAMEMRRLKTAKKPMLVVQGSTVQQFAKAFKLLYPQSKVLIPNDAQRNAKNRKRLLSQIVTGDWDAIVIPHSFFDGIADDPKRERALIEEQLEELEAAMEGAAEADGKNAPTVKQMEKAKKKKAKRLETLLDRRTDDTIFFEQMGIDALLIDEAHSYKRSEFSTKMGNIKGIDSGASQKSSSLLLKSNFIREKTNNKNIILATGTPISNTTAELWTMIRYVKPELLDEYGVSLFDDFAANFGDTSVTTEETDTGGFKEVERFNKFVNGPELLTLFHSASDVVLTQNAGLNLPPIIGGQAESVVIERSEELGEYIEELRELRASFERMTGKEKMENRHIPLLVFGRAKKAAIDLRLIDPVKYKDDPNNKLNQVADNVYDKWKKYAKTKATQVLFLDSYQDATRQFNAYHELRRLMEKRGIPRKEILLISEANNDTQKEAMFQKIREGSARVIIGSTAKLGVGVNMQDKLIAAHHIDVPLRPLDIEQRNGRIGREGNTNMDGIYIINYGVKNTLDSVMYDRLIKKQKFIDQMLNGDINGREFDDPLGEEQISFAEMQAAFAGNPLLFEKSDVTIKIKELEILENSYVRSISTAKKEIRQRNKNLLIAKDDLITAKEKAEQAVKDFPENGPRRFEVNGKELSQKDFLKRLKKFIANADAQIRQLYDGRPARAAMRMIEDEEGRQTDRVKLNGYDVAIKITPGWELTKRKNKKGQISLAALDKAGDLSISITKNQQHFTHFSSPQFTKNLNSKLQKIKDGPNNIEAWINETKTELSNLKKVTEKTFEQKEDLQKYRDRLKEINIELESSNVNTESEENTPDIDSDQDDSITFAKKKKTLKQEGKYGQGTITPSSRRLVLAMRKMGFKAQDGAFKEVQMPNSMVRRTGRIAAIFNKKITFIENTIRDRIDFEGVTIAQAPNTLYIDAATTNPVLQIAAHELLHSIRRTNLPLYWKLRNSVFPQIKHINQYKNLLAERDGKTPDQVTDFNLYEELIADFVGEHLTDTRFWYDLNSRVPKHFKAIAFKVKTFFKNLLRKLKSYNYSEDKDDKADYYFQDIQKVINTVDQALRDYTKENVSKAHDISNDSPTFLKQSNNENFEEQEDTFFKKASDLFVGNLKHRKDKGDNYEEDISAMAHIFKTTMYNAEKIGGAYKRLWNAIRKQNDHKFNAQRKLWYEGDHSLLESFKEFAQKNKAEYKKIKSYLTQRDIERKGFIVKKKGDEFELLHWKKKNGIRQKLGVYADKEMAWEDAIAIEAEESGFSEKGRAALINFRRMSHNLYHHFARNLEEAISAYEKAGQALPQIIIQNEDGSVSIDLRAAADRMGDLRGSYFPRLRNSGKWRVIGSKSGSANKMQFFDTRRLPGGANTYRAELERKGYATKIEKVGKLPEDLFSTLEPLLAQQQVLNSALKDMSNNDKQRVLEDANIKASWRDDVFVLSGSGVYSPDIEQAVKHLGGEFKEIFLKNSFKGEIVFEDIAEQNPDEFEQKVTDAIIHSGGLEVDMDLAFANAMVKQYDTVLKGRGARSRMIARSDSRGVDVVQGYETDPVIAITSAMQAAAGSEAKAMVAKEGTATIAGRDVSWKEFKDRSESEKIETLEEELKDLSLSSPEDDVRKEQLKKDLTKIRQSLINSYGLSPNHIIKKQREIKKILDEMKSLTKWSDIKQAQDLKTQITQAKTGLYEEYLAFVDERKLNAKTQPKAYSEATAALKDILKNQEFADRVLGTLKGLAVWQYLGLRVSSAAVNVTNMGFGVPAAINGETDNQVPLRKALAHIARAMKNFTLHRAGKLDGDQKMVFDEIREKGWDSPVFNQEAFDVLSGRLGRGWSFALEKSMWLFGKAEELNRAATIAATYFSMKEQSQGSWDHDAMMEKAKDISDKAHGDYSKANRPFQMRGENLAGHILQASYVFHTFEHNYLQEMYRLGWDKKQYKAAAYMALSPAIFGIGATLPIGIAKALSSAFGGDDPEEKLIKLAESSFGMGDVARNGIMGIGDHGVNLRGSLATRFGVPNAFADIFGAPGSVVSDWWEGGKNITKGHYQEGFEKILPAAIGNVSKGYRESTSGVTTRSGSPVFWGKDQLKGDSIDMILRMLSFNPTNISKKKEIQWSEYKTKVRYRAKKSEIIKKFKRQMNIAIDKRNRHDILKIKADIRDFNAEIKNKKLTRFGLLITDKSLKDARRRNVKAPKRERLRKISA
ncbi:MAG: PLxRFG domain-containing protein, partial [Desulfobacteraceae bacterium]|nr:PLxRFG domain-containing protein [Desulfobacteraceae bacterium]